jgi:radical SAM superfamily enzyme YgiQ (UPF0313 family)
VSSSLTTGRRPFGANVPILSSVGCPYTCDFCCDWNSTYVALPKEQLEEDLRFVSTRLPGVMVSFHDPNFGVNFDATLSALETIAPEARNPYFMESSLSILKGHRLNRLRDTNCFFVAPGVEGWDDYSGKAAAGSSTGRKKLEKVVAHFQELREYVPNLQANFIFGTDSDQGDEPVDLTSEFIRRVPQAWPALNIPTPFGGTPLYDAHVLEGRLLRAMPFSLYYMPYLVTTVKGYSPLEYYDRMIRLQATACAWGLVPPRVLGAPPGLMRWMNVLRTFGGHGLLARMRAVRDKMRSDRSVLDFHEGRHEELPAHYWRLCTDRLGRYAELLSKADLTPVVEAPVRQVKAALASAAGG